MRTLGRVASAGVLLLAASAASADTVTYSYDALGRLIQTVHSGGPSNGTVVVYQLDAAGNRVRVLVSGAPN